jgi:hypothetical protein
MRVDEGLAKMDDLTNRRTPQQVIEALDASVRDIAEGNLHDADSVQAEARRIFADHGPPPPAAPRSVRGKPARRSRPA